MRYTDEHFFNFSLRSLFTYFGLFREFFGDWTNNNFLKKSSSVSFPGTYKALTSSKNEKNYCQFCQKCVNKERQQRRDRQTDLIYRSSCNLGNKIKTKQRNTTTTKKVKRTKGTQYTFEDACLLGTGSFLFVTTEDLMIFI